MKTIKFWLYTTRAMWRIYRGRWYVLRDAPDYVVEQIAEMKPHLEPTDEVVLVGLVVQAEKELELRGQREAKKSK